MRFYDASVFLGADGAPTLRSLATADDLLREMDDAGVERAVVSDFLAQHQFERGNARLMREVRGRERLTPCWTINPHAFTRRGAVGALVRRLLESNVRIVRLQPGTAHGYSLHAWALQELLGRLAESRIVLYVDFVFEFGYSHAAVPAHDWEALYETARMHRSLPIVLCAPKVSVARMQVMGLLKSCPNVLLDTSAMQLWQATELVCDTVGADRLVFGSHMPYFDPTQFMVQIAYAQINARDREQIAWGNLCRLLGQ